MCKYKAIRMRLLFNKKGNFLSRGIKKIYAEKYGERYNDRDAKLRRYLCTCVSVCAVPFFSGGHEREKKEWHWLTDIFSLSCNCLFI